MGGSFQPAVLDGGGLCQWPLEEALWTGLSRGTVTRSLLEIVAPFVGFFISSCGESLGGGLACEGG